jgi:hypothetical protein
VGAIDFKSYFAEMAGLVAPIGRSYGKLIGAKAHSLTLNGFHPTRPRHDS